MVKAADDYVAIKAALDKIEKEKQAALNTPEEQVAPEPVRPSHDPWGYGSTDYFG